MTDVQVSEGLWDTKKTPEGVVANWFCRNGSQVTTGNTIAEIIVEKTNYEIAASAAGRLTIAVPKDGVVRPGTVIARIEN